MKRWLMLLFLLVCTSGCASRTAGHKPVQTPPQAAYPGPYRVSALASLRQGGAQIGEVTCRYLSYPFLFAGEMSFGLCEAIASTGGSREEVIVTLVLVGAGSVCFVTGYCLDLASDWFELYTDPGYDVRVPIEPPAEEPPPMVNDSGLLRSAVQQNSQ